MRFLKSAIKLNQKERGDDHMNGSSADINNALSSMNNLIDSLERYESVD